MPSPVGSAGGEQPVLGYGSSAVLLGCCSKHTAASATEIKIFTKISFTPAQAAKRGGPLALQSALTAGLRAKGGSGQLLFTPERHLAAPLRHTHALLLVVVVIGAQRRVVVVVALGTGTRGGTGESVASIPASASSAPTREPHLVRVIRANGLKLDVPVSVGRVLEGLAHRRVPGVRCRHAQPMHAPQCQLRGFLDAPHIDPR